MAYVLRANRNKGHTSARGGIFLGAGRGKGKEGKRKRKRGKVEEEEEKPFAHGKVVKNQPIEAAEETKTGITIESVCLRQ